MCSRRVSTSNLLYDTRSPLCQKMNGQRIYECFVLGKDKYHSVQKHSDSNKKLSQSVIIKMIEFLINIFVMFDVFQYTVGIHMGTNSPTCSLYIQIIKLTYTI